MQLFYLQKNFNCIVCTKGSVKQSDGLWKYGIRMHWPDLIVDSEQALYIRESMVAGLDLKDWSPLIGVTRPKWNTIVRSEVYSLSNGIRMIGAPNAKKCNTYTNLNNCSLCGLENGRYIMDENVYALKCLGSLGQSGTFDIDEIKTTAYGSDAAALVKDTSIRRDQDGLEVTSGFKKNMGCLKPQVNNKGKQIDQNACMLKFGSTFTLIEDEEIHSIAKSLLEGHSPVYNLLEGHSPVYKRSWPTVYVQLKKGKEKT